MAAVIARDILPIFPMPMRRIIEMALPAIELQAARLGLEVLDAEQRGLKYSEAVRRVEFIKMQRVYFAATNLLQQPLPRLIQKALKKLVRCAAAGEFDPSRKVIFAIATGTRDPEAALCRFLLWVAIRINLLVVTWSKPEVEAFGVFDALEDRSEEMLRKLLDTSELSEPDVRPLHVLVGGVLHETRLALDRTWIEAIEEWGSELEGALQRAELVGRVRGLDARSAATFAPLGSLEPIGSQQLVDRFPQNFTTVTALEQHRSRLKRSLVKNAQQVRFIDLIQKTGNKD